MEQTEKITIVKESKPIKSTEKQKKDQKQIENNQHLENDLGNESEESEEIVVDDEGEDEIMNPHDGFENEIILEDPIEGTTSEEEGNDENENENELKEKSMSSKLFSKFRTALPNQQRLTKTSNDKSQPTITKFLPLSPKTPAKKKKSSKITEYAECKVCTNTDDTVSLLRCTKCKSLTHPQCLTSIPIDDYDYLGPWICESCGPKDPRNSVIPIIDTSAQINQDDTIIKILRSRVNAGKILQFLVMTEKGKLAWVEKTCLIGNENIALDFLFSENFESIIKTKNVLPHLRTEETITPDGAKLVTFRFCSNNAYFGIKQYRNVFSEQELQNLEKGIDDTVALGESDKLLPSTTDHQPNLHRSKFFFGYGYKDYQHGKRPYLIDNVDPIPNWIQSLVTDLEKKTIISENFIEQAVLNVYHEKGSGLGVHQDPKELFKRPIFSIRLFSDSVLSFGCRGLGMVLRKQAIPLPRGSITVMEGFAANKAKHCVRMADTHEKSSSILLRGINPQAKIELSKRKHPDLLTPPISPNHGLQNVGSSPTRINFDSSPKMAPLISSPLASNKPLDFNTNTTSPTNPIKASRTSRSNSIIETHQHSNGQLNIDKEIYPHLFLIQNTTYKPNLKPTKKNMQKRAKQKAISIAMSTLPSIAKIITFSKEQQQKQQEKQEQLQQKPEEDSPKPPEDSVHQENLVEKETPKKDETEENVIHVPTLRNKPLKALFYDTDSDVELEMERILKKKKKKRSKPSKKKSPELQKVESTIPNETNQSNIEDQEEQQNDDDEINENEKQEKQVEELQENEQNQELLDEDELQEVQQIEQNDKGKSEEPIEIEEEEKDKDKDGEGEVREYNQDIHSEKKGKKKKEKEKKEREKEKEKEKERERKAKKKQIKKAKKLKERHKESKKRRHEHEHEHEKEKKKGKKRSISIDSSSEDGSSSSSPLVDSDSENDKIGNVEKISFQRKKMKSVKIDQTNYFSSFVLEKPGHQRTIQESIEGMNDAHLQRTHPTSIIDNNSYNPVSNLNPTSSFPRNSMSNLNPTSELNPFGVTQTTTYSNSHPNIPSNPTQEISNQHSRSVILFHTNNYQEDLDSLINSQIPNNRHHVSMNQTIHSRSDFSLIQDRNVNFQHQNQYVQTTGTQSWIPPRNVTNNMEQKNIDMIMNTRNFSHHHHYHQNETFSNHNSTFLPHQTPVKIVSNQTHPVHSAPIFHQTTFSNSTFDQQQQFLYQQQQQQQQALYHQQQLLQYQSYSSKSTNLSSFGGRNNTINSFIDFPKRKPNINSSSIDNKISISNLMSNPN